MESADVNAVRRVWLSNGWMDDQLWQQAIVTHRSIGEHWEARDRTADEEILLRLIRLGLYDGRVGVDNSDEKTWSSATRAMFQSSAMCERLWRLVVEERTRVWGNDLRLVTTRAHSSF